MKTLKKISLLTASLALIFTFALSTSHAQDTDTTHVPESETYTLQGKLVDAETTEIITDIEVKVVGKDVSAMTDEEGSYKFENIPAGTPTLKVETQGYQTWEKEVAIDQDKELTIELVSEPTQ